MGKVLLKSTLAIEDKKNPDWRSRTGEPTVWIEATGKEIYLNGTPATGAVLIGYIQRPTAMVSDSDSPDPRIPEVLHQFIKFDAAAWLLQQAGPAQNLAKANDLRQKFLASIGVGPAMIASHVVDR